MVRGTPYEIKNIVVFETYLKIDQDVFKIWKFAGDHDLYWRLTPLSELPYVELKKEEEDVGTV